MSTEEDPPRLDADASAPPSLQRALRAAARHEPSEDALRALGAALGPMLGPPGAPPGPLGGTGSPAPGAPGVGASGATPALGKLALGVVAASAAIAIGFGIARSKGPEVAPSSPIASIAAPSAQATVVATTVEPPSPSASAIETAPSAVASTDTPPSSTVAASAPSVTSSSVATGETPSEVSLLSRAKKALDRDPATALALTAEHRRLYPKGQLSQEREIIAIEALRKLGRSGDADTGSDRFHTQYPSSIHQQSVEKPPH